VRQIIIAQRIGHKKGSMKSFDEKYNLEKRTGLAAKGVLIANVLHGRVVLSYHSMVTAFEGRVEC